MLNFFGLGNVPFDTKTLFGENSLIGGMLNQPQQLPWQAADPANPGPQLPWQRPDYGMTMQQPQGLDKSLGGLLQAQSLMGQQNEAPLPPQIMPRQVMPSPGAQAQVMSMISNQRPRGLIGM